jgi:hypothetical protein
MHDRRLDAIGEARRLTLSILRYGRPVRSTRHVAPQSHAIQTIGPSMPAHRSLQRRCVPQSAGVRQPSSGTAVRNQMPKSAPRACTRAVEKSVGPSDPSNFAKAGTSPVTNFQPQFDPAEPALASRIHFLVAGPSPCPHATLVYPFAADSVGSHRGCRTRFLRALGAIAIELLGRGSGLCPSSACSQSAPRRATTVRL